MESPVTPSLRLAVAQPRSVLDDVVANVGHHARLVRRAEARVVVFPELSLSGYSLDPTPIAPDDARLAPLVEACRRSRSVALVGAAVADPARPGAPPRIAMLRVDHDGVAAVYHKMWLGDDEQGRFSPGDRPAVITVDGWRLGAAICKDTGIPDHATGTVAAGIDIYVAGVCESEADRLVPATRARRITAAHGVWVAMAGFAGPTGGGFDETAGRSAIWHPDGSAAAQLDRHPDRVVTVTVAR